MENYFSCNFCCSCNCRSNGNNLSDLSGDGDRCSARGLKHPKLWGMLAANGNNSSGLLLYLIGRRKYPRNAIDIKQLQLMDKKKKAAGIGLVFLAVGAIGLVVCLARVGL